MSVEIGKAAPAFTMPTDGNGKERLAEKVRAAILES